MPPEPDNLAVLARAAHVRILAGDDVQVTVLDAMRAAVQQDRARRGEPFDDPREHTPTITAQEKLQGRPSRRPTKLPPPPPLPLGVPSEGRRTPTLRDTPVPPPERKRR